MPIRLNPKGTVKHHTHEKATYILIIHSILGNLVATSVCNTQEIYGEEMEMGILPHFSVCANPVFHTSCCCK